MISMARTPEDIKDIVETQQPEMPIYPYGLCISLTHDELEKLDLDADCEIGDMVHLMAMAKVTSVSKNETTDGETCRIELQITDLSVEDEDEEGELEAQERPRIRMNDFYKS